MGVVPSLQFRVLQVAVAALAIYSNACITSMLEPTHLVPHGFVASLAPVPHAHRRQG